MTSSFLPGLPVDLIRAAYATAPGDEINSDRFDSPESSSALVANTFSVFLNWPGNLPPLGLTLMAAIFLVIRQGQSPLRWPAAAVLPGSRPQLPPER